MPVDAYHDDETGGDLLYADEEEEVLDDTYGQKWMEDTASRTFSEKNYGRALQMMSLINARARAPLFTSGDTLVRTLGAEHFRRARRHR